MPKLVESIFNYKDKDGDNCLIVSFDLIGQYQIANRKKRKTPKYPNSNMPMFDEIELTILFLIELAENNNLNMDKILNTVNEGGKTLFWNAAFNYEWLALELLGRNVDVKTVDHLFQTPLFQVSSILCWF